MFHLIISMALCAADLWCKSKVDYKDVEIARKLRRLPRKFAHDSFRIDCVHNEGFFCNLLDSHPIIPRILSCVMLAAVAVMTVFACVFGACGLLIRLGLALILGGGASNTIDRVRKGYVVDYLNIRCCKPLKDTYFNLGDVGILAGAVLFLLGSLFHCLKRNKE